MKKRVLIYTILDLFFLLYRKGCSKVGDIAIPHFDHMLIETVDFQMWEQFCYDKDIEKMLYGG